MFDLGLHGLIYPMKTYKGLMYELEWQFINKSLEVHCLLIEKDAMAGALPSGGCLMSGGD